MKKNRAKAALPSPNNDEYIDQPTAPDFSQKYLHHSGEIDLRDWGAFWETYRGFVISYCEKAMHISDQDLRTNIVGDLCSRIIKNGLLDKYRAFKHNRKDIPIQKRGFRCWFRTTIKYTAIALLNEKGKDEKKYKPYSETILDFIAGEDAPRNKKIDPAETECYRQGLSLSDDDLQDDDETWKQMIAVLAIDAAEKKSTPLQINCFIWRHRDGRKPAEIAKFLDISANEVSEAIRAFKNKCRSELTGLDADYRITNDEDWKKLTALSDAAKQRYQKISRGFVTQYCQSGKNQKECYE